MDDSRKNIKEEQISSGVSRLKNTALYIIAVTSLMFVVSSCVLAYISVMSYRESFYGYCSDLCRSNNAQAAFIIDGDLVENYAKNLTVDDTYEQFAARLDELQKYIDIKQMYIMADTGIPDKYTLIYETESSAEALGQAKDKSSFFNADEVLQSGKGFDDAYYYKHETGEIYFSYAPIFNSDNEVVAFVGTSIDITPLREQLTSYILIIVTILFISVGLFVLMIYFVIRRIYIIPMKQLISCAEDITNGNLNSTIPDELRLLSDESSKLAGAFASVSGKIHELVYDIEKIMTSIQFGQISDRIKSDNYKGDYFSIISGINNTLDILNGYFNSIPDCIAFLDGVSDNRTVYCNTQMKEFAELHGINAAKEDIIARILEFHENEKIRSYLNDFFKGDRDVPCTCTINIPSVVGGSLKTYSMTICFVKNSSGASKTSKSCIMLILSDITILTKARKDSDSANKEKTEFLSKMSHEIRTPMNAIMGMVKIAESTHDYEKIKYCMNDIKDSSVYLLNLINDIHDMSKIETGKFNINEENINIEKVIIKLYNIMIEKAMQKKQEFNIILDENLHNELIGDEHRISQVLTNLLLNAFEFTPEKGKITLELEEIEADDNFSTLRFTVADTGIGMSKEQIEQLFNAYEQADGTIAHKRDGSGLGLTISKSIIEKMNGTAWVKSKLGEGSQFMFEIKLQRRFKKGE